MRRFAKVSKEEIEKAFVYVYDLVNTKTTIPLRVGEERWICTLTLRIPVYIHHYSPPLWGIVVYYWFMVILCVLQVMDAWEREKLLLAGEKSKIYTWQ